MLQNSNCSTKLFQFIWDEKKVYILLCLESSSSESVRNAVKILENTHKFAFEISNFRGIFKDIFETKIQWSDFLSIPLLIIANFRSKKEVNSALEIYPEIQEWISVSSFDIHGIFKIFSLCH